MRAIHALGLGIILVGGTLMATGCTTVVEEESNLPVKSIEVQEESSGIQAVPEADGDGYVRRSEQRREIHVEEHSY